MTTFDDTEAATAATDDGVMTMGTADGTAGETMPSTSDPTTPGSTTDDPGSTTDPAGCNPPCAADEECIDGACVPIGGGCNAVAGNYDDCLGAGDVVDVTGCGGGTPTCITGGDPAIAGVCAQSDCVDACDCPGAPLTGNSVVTCDAITGDGTNFCYLDCSGGETCPSGTICFADIACLWPGEGADGVPYGDCLNNGPSICGLDGICLSDDPAGPLVSVCTEDCINAGDCAPSPGGTAPATCQDVTADGANECVIDCSGGGSCPAGMVCFSGFLCMWD